MSEKVSGPSPEELGVGEGEPRAPSFEKRFVTAEELAGYREARIKEGGLYQIARGMLVYPHFDNINEQEHERLVNLQDSSNLTPYVRGYQEAVAADKLGQVGQITDLHRVDDPVLPKRKLTIATVSYGDGTSVNIASLNLARPTRADLEQQDVWEAYRSYYSFERDGHEFNLGDRVLVDGLFIGRIRAVWPKQGESLPLVGVEATEQHYVAVSTNPDTYAPVMGGEKRVFLALNAGRLSQAPEPAVFTSNLRIRDES